MSGLVLPSAAALEPMPTLSADESCDRKIDTGDFRVWLSRLGLADGEPFERTVYVEGRSDDGSAWVVLGYYDGDDPRRCTGARRSGRRRCSVPSTPSSGLTCWPMRIGTTGSSSVRSGVRSASGRRNVTLRPWRRCWPGSARTTSRCCALRGRCAILSGDALLDTGFMSRTALALVRGPFRV